MKTANLMKNIIMGVGLVLVLTSSSLLWATSGVNFYCLGSSLKVGAETGSNGAYINVEPGAITAGPYNGVLDPCYYAGGNVYSLGIVLNTSGAKSAYANVLLSKSLNSLVRIYIDTGTCRVEEIVLQ